MCRAIMKFVVKLAFSVVRRIEALEESCASDTIELNEIARDMSGNNHIADAARLEVGQQAFTLLAVFSIHHITFLLGSSIASLQPIALITFKRCCRDIVLAHQPLYR